MHQPVTCHHPRFSRQQRLDVKDQQVGSLFIESNSGSLRRDNLTDGAGNDSCHRLPSGEKDICGEVVVG